MKLPPAPFIVSAARSGATMLRLMLDAHPELAIPPETGFIPAANELADRGEASPEAFARLVRGFPPGASAWVDYGLDEDDFEQAVRDLDPFGVADGIRTFYERYAARFDKSRWGDKTPMYCRQMPAIAGILPEARFIHLLRDGRDAAVSLRSMWFAPGQDGASLARKWAADVTAARHDGTLVPYYLEVRYEELVADTEGQLRRICDFIELGYEPCMPRFYENARERIAEHQARVHDDGTVLVSRRERHSQQRSALHPATTDKVGIWRDAMAKADVDAFNDIAGPLLSDLGY